MTGAESVPRDRAIARDRLAEDAPPQRVAAR